MDWSWHQYVATYWTWLCQEWPRCNELPLRGADKGAAILVAPGLNKRDLPARIANRESRIESTSAMIAAAIPTTPTGFAIPIAIPNPGSVGPLMIVCKPRGVESGSVSPNKIPLTADEMRKAYVIARVSNPPFSADWHPLGSLVGTIYNRMPMG